MKNKDSKKKPLSKKTSSIKKVKKNPVKKIVRKIAKKEQSGVMAVIPYNEISKVEVHKGKFSLIPTPFTELQLQAIVAPTPKEIIKSRPGKGGGNWDYVPGWYFKKKLNFVFGFAHDFDILGERVDGDFITVKGQLTVRDPKTGQVLAKKTDYGGSEIKYKKGVPRNPSGYLDIANDFKAASTDCFKRCAVQLGFAMDVYGKNESKDEGYQVVEVNEEPLNPIDGSDENEFPSEKDVNNLITAALGKGFTNKKQILDAANKALKTNYSDLSKLNKKEIILLTKALVKDKKQFKCIGCGNSITEQENNFSVKMFKKSLCRECQKNSKK